MYEIILGRNETDRKKYGKNATIFLGKHYVTMERAKSLANPMLLDVARPHVILVCGKRGSGKSYTLGVMAEGLLHLEKGIKENISCIIFDTMGIYWTMKYPNYRDDTLLQEWDMEAKNLEPVIFVPKKMFSDYQRKSIPVDKEFSINPAELDPSEWCALFGIELNSDAGVLIEEVVLDLKEGAESFSVQDIVNKIQETQSFPTDVKQLLVSRFRSINKWGVFSEGGTSITELAQPGQVTVLDLSAFSNMPENMTIKSLVIGFISRKILQKRLMARKLEEIEQIQRGSTRPEKQEPLVWMLIDEAHEFLPKERDTLATLPLIQLLREGRQPGISLIMATQQPGKIHTDALTQADIVISHRLTARLDINALNEIMQSYLPFKLQRYIDNLPRVKGAAISLDDTSEKIYPFKVRPRISWHGGEDPSAMKKIKELSKLKQEEVQTEVKEEAQKRLVKEKPAKQNLFERIEKLGVA